MTRGCVRRRWLGAGALCGGDRRERGGRLRLRRRSLSVDTDAARALARTVLDQGIDLTVSARMTVDHGFVQPLAVLFGGIGKVPVVPVFVNGVATPLGPVSRIRALGDSAHDRQDTPWAGRWSWTGPAFLNGSATEGAIPLLALRIELRASTGRVHYPIEIASYPRVGRNSTRGSGTER
ncbi:hypothetical protein ABT383_23745 [Streptomyces humidus]|uniref:DODA-type extradiol aromatic ring-opening family dioxygenase n=1 Tax=Streptomyces humidus TaxID=52259 RepID=UPI001E5DCC8F|nr:hypothetical protein [Streptomyces humidus]